MRRHAMLALLGPEMMAAALAEAGKNEPVIARNNSVPPPPDERILLSGRPGTNRHARRKAKVLARRK